MSEHSIRTFVDCLCECANTLGFVGQFKRLTGYHLTPQSAPDSADARAFVAFVARWVWQPWLDALERDEASRITDTDPRSSSPDRQRGEGIL
jgi:hypothetical protein